MNDKIDVFPVYTRKEAAKATEIMHKLFNKIEADPEAARVYYAFEQILDNFESKQAQLSVSEPHVLLQEILLVRGISNRDFAVMLKTSETALSAILSGNRPISERMAHRIAKALSIDPSSIFSPRSKTSAA